MYDVHKTGLLIDGRNYYRAFYDIARQARQYILIAGWQFERGVPLLRGKDVRDADGEVVMAAFLDELCSKNPGLEIFILMWDFSAIVAFDKEWFNKYIFDLTAADRIHFRFDSKHALYASHHQKLIVIDGVHAFAGGLDICANSWDDRTHWADNAERVLAGELYEPYHDVQSFSTGPIAWELTKLFMQRWIYSGGPPLSLPRPASFPEGRIRKMIPLSATKAAISTTRAQTLVPMAGPILEIRQLYIDAIASAQKLIYIENQYFTSQVVYQALRDRMTDRNRPCPEIVLILPRRFHTLVEDISLSAVQAKMLRSLTEIAARNGAHFGVYYTAAALTKAGTEKATYIHSKILLIDDRFLSVGSANTTNRSMGMDTELNLSWEADTSDQRDLIRSIRRVRANLLAEHTGLRRLSQLRALRSMDGFVEYLNSNADRLGCRLRRHTMESFLQDVAWVKDLVPEDLSIDPEHPMFEDSIYELISRDSNGVFAKGIILLNQFALEQTELALSEKKGDQPEAGKSSQQEASAIRKSLRNLDDRGRLRWYTVAAIGLGIAVVVWLLFVT